MTIRSASLLSALALAAAAMPAFAQDGGYHPGPPPPLPDIWDEEWEEYPEDSYEDGIAAWEEHSGPQRGLPPQQLGYSAAQRAQWLEQCRAAYDDASGRRRGETIGGVLGAVAGGLAGNRIADGARLGGTLISAGVGGLAGAAIGGAIGAGSDRAHLDQCEDYLVRYEQGFRGYGHGEYGHPYVPVMWIKVPIVTHRHGRDCGCETVVEEWADEELAPAPRAKRVKIRRIAPDKRVPAGK